MKTYNNLAKFIEMKRMNLNMILMKLNNINKIFKIIIMNFTKYVSNVIKIVVYWIKIEKNFCLRKVKKSF